MQLLALRLNKIFWVRSLEAAVARYSLFWKYFSGLKFPVVVVRNKTTVKNEDHFPRSFFFFFSPSPVNRSLNFLLFFLLLLHLPSLHHSLTHTHGCWMCVCVCLCYGLMCFRMCRAKRKQLGDKNHIGIVSWRLRESFGLLLQKIFPDVWWGRKEQNTTAVHSLKVFGSLNKYKSLFRTGTVDTKSIPNVFC